MSQAQAVPEDDLPTQAVPDSDLPTVASSNPVTNVSPDTSAMKDYVDKNLAAYQQTQEFKDRNPTQNPAKGFWDSLKAGFQGSSLGLAWREKMPDTTLPPDADRSMRIANQIGSLAGDLPAMVAGGSFGGGLGAGLGATEGSVVPVAGTAAGAVAGAATGSMAGAFAVPQALRKILIDHYQKGDITTAGEFATRLMSTSWEAMKGALTGVATEATGGLGKAVAGPIGHFAGQLHNIDAATGEHPADVIEAAKRDTQLKQDLQSNDPNLPPQAAPAELQHFSQKEGTIPTDAEQEKEIPPPSQQWELKPKEETPVSGGSGEGGPPRTPEEAEIASKIGTEPEAESKTFKEKYDEIYAKSIDWTDPLKVVVQAMKETKGIDLPADQDPHIQARLFAGHMDQLRMILENGIPDKDGNFSGDSLNKVYKDVPDDNQSGFDLYSVAKRAIELDDRGKVPWKDFNRENAEKVVSDGADKYQEIHERRVQVLNDVLDYGVKKGVIDPKVAELSKEQNKEYIPFNRIVSPDELTGETIGSGKLVKKIEGSELDLKNPRVSIYQNIAAIIRRAEINDIRTKAMDNLSYVDSEGNKKNDFLREIKPNAKPVEISKEELSSIDFDDYKKQVRSTLPNATLEDIKKAYEGENVPAFKDIKIWRKQKITLGDSQIAIYRNGELHALEGTPLVIDSLRRLEGDRTMSDLVTKIAQKFSTAVRVGTVIDPGFGFRHFFRSALMSGVYTKTGQIPFYHSALNLSEFMAGKSDVYKNWLYDGGAVAAIDKLQSTYIDNDLQGSDSKYPFLNNAWNVIKTPFEASEAFIKASDNLSRFTEYKRAIEQGKTRDEAAFMSREVTPDFQKIGLQRSALRTSIAFIGAHINSLDRMKQSFAEDPQGTILRMSVLSGISAAVWLVNKDDKAIDDLPNYQKDLYWNFHIPNSQMIFRLPKPWGPGILFGSGVERTLDAFMKHDPDAYKGYAKSLLDSVAPNVVPTMLSPVLDQMANKNMFTGRQLVNEQQEKLLPELQYQPYTSETAKQLAKLIGYVPAVKDIGPSSDPLASPEVVDNYIRGWTGTVGGIAIKIADAGLHKAGIGVKPGVEKPEGSIADAAILNEFVTRFPSMKSQPIQTFYENYQATSKVMTSIRYAAKNGDIEAAMQIAKENPELEIKLDGINKSIGAGRKVIDFIQNKSTMDPVQKRQIIDTTLFQINSAAKMGNQMMNDYKKGK